VERFELAMLLSACGIQVSPSTLEQLNEYLNNDREIKNKETIDADILCKVMK